MINANMQWLAEVGVASHSVVVSSHGTQTILATTLFLHSDVCYTGTHF